MNPVLKRSAIWAPITFSIAMAAILGYHDGLDSSAATDAIKAPKDFAEPSVDSPSLHSLSNPSELFADKSAWTNNYDEVFLAMLSLDPTPSPDQVLEFLASWVSHDANAAFAAASNLPPRFKNRGTYIYPRLLAAGLASDTLTTLQWVNKLQRDAVGFSLLAKPWVGDPAEMAENLTHLEPGSASHSIIAKVALEWAEQDFDAAFAWSQTLPPELRRYAMPYMVDRWAEKDIESTIDYFANQASSAERQSSINNMLHHYAKQNPQEALEWQIENMGRVDYGIFRDWSGTDLEGLTNYIQETPNPQLQTFATQTASRSIANRGFNEFQEWTANLSPELRTDAMKGAAKTLMRQHHEEFMQSVATMEEESITSELLDNMALAHRENPEDSLQWATHLPGEAAARGVASVIRGWAAQNTEAAHAAAESLTDEVLVEAARGALSDRD